MPDGGYPDLVETYLERRVALVRFFTLRLASAARAEDLVQEIYLKIQAMDDASLATVQNPPAFLYRLGSNLMLDRLKQERRSRAREADWADSQTVSLGGEDVADVPAADDALAARQRLAAIITAINELAPATRQAFRLHKLEGLSHAETAEAMGISRSGVEKHISAALKHLVKRVL